MTTKPFRYSESPRLRTFDYKGHFAYHVTIVTAERQAVLLEDAHEVVRTLRFAAEATAFNVLVYAIMPDHLHVLVSGKSSDSNLVRFVQRFKQLTGYEFKQRHGRSLWQRSYHDHVLRRSEEVADTARYILGNPVEAGIAERWEDWPHCGGELLDDTTVGQ
jgi:REP element-mobilizing transposase RayT